MKCPGCGGESEGSAVFCEMCGAKLEAGREGTGQARGPRLLQAVPGPTRGAQGAMGIVYLARDDRIGRNVAIKALKIDPNLPEGDRAQVAERFEREARAVGMLSHHNIVTVHLRRDPAPSR